MATVPGTLTWSAGSILTAAQLNTYLTAAVAFFLSQPVCELRQTVAQSLTTSVGAALLYDTEDIDTDNMHSTVSNTSRVTAQTAGRFMISGGVGFAANATGLRVTYYAINGTNNSGSGVELSAAGGGGVTLLGARSKSIFLNVGDYVEMFALQTSGGSLNTDVSGLDQPNFTVRWVGTT